MVDRNSTCISRKMTQNIFRAFDFARACGVPFNLYVTLHIHETDAQAAATVFERIRHKYRDWLSYRARALGQTLAPMYAYSFEAPGNPHVNWVLSIPPELLDAFRSKLPRWIGKVQGPLDRFDLRVAAINPAAYKQMANYLVKGCDPAFLQHFHLNDFFALHGPQGTFWGKRAGVSPSFNKSARAAAGYDARRRRLPPQNLAACELDPAAKPEDTHIEQSEPRVGRQQDRAA
jgi:hypothetical protein